VLTPHDSTPKCAWEAERSDDFFFLISSDVSPAEIAEVHRRRESPDCDPDAASNFATSSMPSFEPSVVV